MAVVNLDPLIDKVLGKENELLENSFLLPKNPFHSAITGQTGCGKTTLLLNLLLKYYHYSKVYICAKDIKERHYEFIIKFFEQLNQERSKAAQQKLPLTDILETFNNLDDMPAAESLPKDDLTRIVVFDDWINEPHQDKIEDYYTMGRKRGCSCIYISQRYIEIPKVVRTQTSVFFIFKQKKQDVTAIFNDLIDDMPIEKFRELMKRISKIPHGFLTIDRKETLLKYRIGLDEFLVLDCQKQDEA